MTEKAKKAKERPVCGGSEKIRKGNRREVRAGRKKIVAGTTPEEMQREGSRASLFYD